MKSFGFVMSAFSSVKIGGGEVFGNRWECEPEGSHYCPAKPQVVVGGVQELPAVHVVEQVASVVPGEGGQH